MRTGGAATAHFPGNFSSSQLSIARNIDVSYLKSPMSGACDAEPNALQFTGYGRLTYQQHAGRA